MPKSKAKNDIQKPSLIMFRATWASSYAALWMVLWALVEYREYRSDAFNVPAVVLAITAMTLITSFLQSRVSRRLFKPLAQGWIEASLLGVGASILAFMSVGPADWLISSLALLVPTALVQALWLWWRGGRSAWLWPLASVTASLFFVVPFREYVPWDINPLSYLVVLVLGFVHGLIQSIVMKQIMSGIEDEGEKLSPADQTRNRSGLPSESYTMSDRDRVRRLQDVASTDTDLSHQSISQYTDQA